VQGDFVVVDHVDIAQLHPSARSAPGQQL
jgi:hypothetical protein